MCTCGRRAGYAPTSRSNLRPRRQPDNKRHPVHRRIDSIGSVAIVGLGLMGGSFGMSCLRKGLVERVVGFDTDPDATRAALDAGAITHGAFTLPWAVKEADLVVVATPVGAISEVVADAAPYLKPGSIVTDVGSTKAGIVKHASETLPAAVTFVGGHPVAGSENHGIAAASPELYEGCLWILTPATVPEQPLQALESFLTGLGAKVLKLDPLKHDEALALTSHLPQLLSSTLMSFAADAATSGEGMPLLTAGGFRDMTRIAASSPEMWVDIVKENQPALLALLRRFQQTLATMAETLESGDWETLRRSLDQAREVRRALPLKAGLDVAELEEVLVAVPDRPGVLAEVSTTLREAGVNIEDLNIVHLPEGGRGVIHIAVSGAPAAGIAVKALRERGFSVEQP